MDKECFTMRVLGLVLSIFLSYIAIAFSLGINGTYKNFIFSILADKNILFSFMSILVLCFFDLVDIFGKIGKLTTAFALVFWVMTIFLAFLTYILLNDAKATLMSNIAALSVTVVEYCLFSRLIALNKGFITEEGVK